MGGLCDLFNDRIRCPGWSEQSGVDCICQVRKTSLRRRWNLGRREERLWAGDSEDTDVERTGGLRDLFNDRLRPGPKDGLLWRGD